MTKELSSARYEVVSGLRTTSDGYYESCVVVIEGNQIEITERHDKECCMNEFYKLIMWQMAQVLGYEGRKELSDHAILLLVDFNSDLVHPVFIGKNMMLNGIHSSAWSQTTKNIITNAIAENYRSEVALFSRRMHHVGNMKSSAFTIP